MCLRKTAVRFKFMLCYFNLNSYKSFIIAINLCIIFYLSRGHPTYKYYLVITKHFICRYDLFHFKLCYVIIKATKLNVDSPQHACLPLVVLVYKHHKRAP